MERGRGTLGVGEWETGNPPPCPFTCQSDCPQVRHVFWSLVIFTPGQGGGGAVHCAVGWADLGFFCCLFEILKVALDSVTEETK